jgi:hypothetical protein
MGRFTTITANDRHAAGYVVATMLHQAIGVIEVPSSIREVRIAAVIALG